MFIIIIIFILFIFFQVLLLVILKLESRLAFAGLLDTIMMENAQISCSHFLLCCCMIFTYLIIYEIKKSKTTNCKIYKRLYLDIISFIYYLIFRNGFLLNKTIYWWLVSLQVLNSLKLYCILFLVYLSFISHFMGQKLEVR